MTTNSVDPKLMIPDRIFNDYEGELYYKERAKWYKALFQHYGLTYDDSAEEEAIQELSSSPSNEHPENT